METPNPTLHPLVDPEQELIGLLETVIKREASDLHLSVGRKPTLRIDGKLVEITEEPILTPEHTEKLVLALLNDEQKEIFISNREIDFSVALQDKGRFRVNAFHQKGYMGAALRLIPTKIRTLEELNVPKQLYNFAKASQGLVLVTGPTGHGKSTTQAALIDYININRGEHIITIEDPVEYTHNHKGSIVDQREVHQDTKSFAAALRSALREDPDVLLIGEMRDLETIATAITVAETGHLVFATVHTNNAAQTMDRLIDVFPPHQQGQIRIQLSNILLGIVAQRLLPRISGGRIPSVEILMATPAVRNIIREGKTEQLPSVIQTSLEGGMISMDKALAELVLRGEVAMQDAEKWSSDPKAFHRLLGR